MVGLGTAVAPSGSTQVLGWKNQEGTTGKVQPYVCAIPVTLWGRDVLEQLHLQTCCWQLREKTP